METLFLALLLSPLVSLTAACPAECVCLNNDRNVICSGTNVNGFPAGLPTNVQSLSITGSYSQRATLPSLGANDLKPFASSLLTLVISQTDLQTIDPAAFQGLDNLKSVDLSHNLLTNLEPDVFRNMRNVSILHLTGNERCSLPVNLFRDMVGLKELYLGSMSLGAINLGLFAGVTSIMALDLSDNGLQDLPNGMTDPTFLPGLKSLDLSYNRLTRLSESFKPLFARVTMIVLSDNLWECDCQLKWMKAFKAHVFPAYVSSHILTCDSPENFRYQALALIPDNQLICTPAKITSCLNIAPTMEGEMIVVNCTIDGMPFPNVSWMLPDGSVFSGLSSIGRQQLVVSKPTIAISIRASAATNGSLTVSVENLMGHADQKIDLIVLTTTTSSTTTSTSTTTTSTTTTTTTATTPSSSEKLLSTIAAASGTKDSEPSQSEAGGLDMMSLGIGIGAGAVLGTVVTVISCLLKNRKKEVDPDESSNGKKDSKDKVQEAWPDQSINNSMDDV